MTREAAATRLLFAERELRQVMLEHDGTDRSVERYRAAVSELVIASSIAVLNQTYATDAEVGHVAD
jgi:hypothetical protein